MKKLLSILFAFSIIFFFSCKNGEEKNTNETTQTMAAASFKLMMIKHPVADFEKWKPVYLAHDSMRKAFGINSFALGRVMEDPNQLILIEKISDLQKAKDFTTLPDLKDAMANAGVTGSPVFEFADAVRSDDSKIDIKERVLIKHRVKDFDAWLKVFDSEGMKTRSENGIIDRGLARGSEDPNTVYIVFAISDMMKAKARMNSEDLKAIMTNAGVEGPPEITFYTLVD